MEQEEMDGDVEAFFFRGKGHYSTQVGVAF